MKWLIFTGHSPEYEELGALTVPNHRRYAAAHGYDMFVHHCERGNAAADTWDKARWARFLQLLPLYDAVMTVGADALFMRLDVTLDSLIDPPGTQPVARWEQVIAEERIGGCDYNNDVMLWRNCESTVTLIRWILDGYEEHLRINPLGYQAGLEAMLRTRGGVDEDKRVAAMRVVPARTMNACPQQGTPASYKAGDFIVHFWGAPLANKIVLAREYLEAAQ